MCVCVCVGSKHYIDWGWQKVDCIDSPGDLNVPPQMLWFPSTPKVPLCPIKVSIGNWLFLRGPCTEASGGPDASIFRGVFLKFTTGEHKGTFHFKKL